MSKNHLFLMTFNYRAILLYQYYFAFIPYPKAKSGENMTSYRFIMLSIYTLIPLIGLIKIQDT